MFFELIGKTMEVYIEDILVKSKKASQHVENLNKMFQVLWKFWMKLNPLKCVFEVALGKFLRYMVNEHGIEANPKMI